MRQIADWCGVGALFGLLGAALACHLEGAQGSAQWLLYLTVALVGLSMPPARLRSRATGRPAGARTKRGEHARGAP